MQVFEHDKERSVACQQHDELDDSFEEAQMVVPRPDPIAVPVSELGQEAGQLLPPDRTQRAHQLYPFGC